MRKICYVLLSPTWGMHQYTADLANRMVAAGHDVHLVTTRHYPPDRYLPTVQVHTPLATRTTGLGLDGLRLAGIRRAACAVRALAPDLVHLTGPHLWNLPLLAILRRAGLPVAHTIHDLDPHHGSPYGPLLYLWNRAVIRRADHLLVHGDRYRSRLLDAGLPPDRITCTPLLHLFLGHTWLGGVEDLAADVRYEPAVLFFGRMAPYKGIDHLLAAWALADGRTAGARLVLAGPGDLGRLWAGALPPGVEVRNHLVDDAEALALFRHCGLLALPYRGATQSALVPAAYFFRKPVLVAPSGALDEYVEHGRTGWVVEPEHPASLARSLSTILADLDRLAFMGRAGRAWYDARRGQEQQALHQMYTQLAARRGA